MNAEMPDSDIATKLKAVNSDMMKLQELKAASDEAWEDLKSVAEKAWIEV